MIIVIAIDALEYNLVERFGCKNLKQEYYGKTDISEFSQPRTMVLWGSFLCGKNIEKEILSRGNKEMWNFKLPIEETFLSKFKNPKVIDLPAFSYDTTFHQRSRELLREFFEAENDDEKTKIRKEYNKLNIKHDQEVKEEFLKSLNKRHDFVLAYFSAIDTVGHLNFGNTLLMKILYKDMDELVGNVRSKYPNAKILVLSDHGMKGNMFGEHTNYGFWSTNFKHGLLNPKITDIHKLLL